MARPVAEVEDYVLVRDRGELLVGAAAVELLGAGVAERLRAAGLLTVGVLDSLADVAPEIRLGVFADAVGELGIGLEDAWAQLLRASSEPARLRRRLFARTPPEVGAHWPAVMGLVVAGGSARGGRRAGAWPVHASLAPAPLAHPFAARAGGRGDRSWA